MMRVWGRVGGGVNGVGGTWVPVTTDANGDDSNVYLTALCQVLKLSLGESPMYYTGIPSQQSVNAQRYPDYWVMLIQQAYAAFFVSLIITRIQSIVTPTYTVKVVTFAGAILTATVAL